MLAPAVIYIVALLAFPLGLAIAYSLSDVTTGNQTLHWVGLRNFKDAIDSGTFRTALKNTFIFTIASNVLMLVLANILAIALSAKFPGKWFVRFLILLPWATPVALAAIGWLWMLDSIYSPIDWVLRSVGLIGHHGDLLSSSSNMYWLGRKNLAMLSVIMVHTWRLVPLATVIIVAGMTSIPQDLKDAAAIDGAGFWRRMFSIEIPLLLPIMNVALLFGIVFTFTDMTVVYVLTRGGPVDSTQVLASWAYFKGIQGGNLGEGAAVALFLLPVLVIVAFLMLRSARRTELT